MSLFIIRKAFSVSDNEEESVENDFDETFSSDEILLSNKVKVDMEETNLPTEKNLNKFEVTRNSFLYTDDNFGFMEKGRV